MITLIKAFVRYVVESEISDLTRVNRLISQSCLILISEATQTHVGKGMDTKKFGINITGGNFVQSSIMNSGPVTYNNTNTVISTTCKNHAKYLSIPEHSNRYTKFQICELYGN